MTDLWSTDESGPVHPVRHHMAENRVFQLRRFFHISGPNQEDKPVRAGTARVSTEDEGQEAKDWPEHDSEFDEAPELPELDDGDGNNPDGDEATILALEENP